MLGDEPDALCSQSYPCGIRWSVTPGPDTLAASLEWGKGDQLESRFGQWTFSSDLSI